MSNFVAWPIKRRFLIARQSRQRLTVTAGITVRLCAGITAWESSCAEDLFRYIVEDTNLLLESTIICYRCSQRNKHACNCEGMTRHVTGNCQRSPVKPCPVKQYRALRSQSRSRVTSYNFGFPCVNVSKIIRMNQVPIVYHKYKKFTKKGKK